MNLRGITHRDTKGVRQKISDLQSSYNTARDFLKNTGEGIMENDEINGVRTVEDCINTLCRYWSFLDPIMGSRSVTEPLHVRSSVSGDQPGRQDSPEPNNDPPPTEPTRNTDDSASLASDESNLPEVSALMPAPRLSASTPAPQISTSTPAVLAQKTKQIKRKSHVNRPTTQSSTRSSRHKRNNTEELYMRSIVSKRQADITRARAEASKIKIAYMKELREHGLSFEEIEAKAIIEFPQLAEMDDGGEGSDDESNDSS
ncbi:hypothetical protein PtA15_1A1016 [Puccinia triticina]|uniref:No apical meristem-associated C-terminal domain-containing protein n=1 Tax=Puccinia triticina TaxID=208348 RepID=A0ABY7C943_9BASI|nr:uncharacterized protein PtA15_1A1016 [Puccinia triticina]WAQ81674.1 hypothetical protein PtA15_1A1016 [Puccinia triticina]